MSVENEAPPVDPAIDPDIEPPVPRDTRRIVGELIEPEKPDEDITVLTDEERSDFSKLLTIGRRVKKVTVMDHSVTIRTLKTCDEMRIGLYTKDYLDSQGFSRAYQVGTCAAGIVELDGSPVYRPLSDKEDAQAIFVKSCEKLSEYYPIVISQIYDAIIALEREFADLAIKLGKNKRLDESTEIVIRLAFHQGLLTQKELNKFQHFAMSYHLGLSRRTMVKDINDTLEKFVWYTDEDRFNELFFTPTFDAEGQLVYDGELAEEVETDLDQIDRYFEQLDEKKAMSGAQLFSYLDRDEQGWT